MDHAEAIRATRQQEAIMAATGKVKIVAALEEAMASKYFYTASRKAAFSLSGKERIQWLRRIFREEIGSCLYNACITARRIRAFSKSKDCVLEVVRTAAQQMCGGKTISQEMVTSLRGLFSDRNPCLERMDVVSLYIEAVKKREFGMADALHNIIILGE